jgi:zinc protease
VAGDIDTAKTRALVEKWFGDVKPGAAVEPLTVPGVALTGVQRKTITDRVQLPKLYLAWLTPPHLAPMDAALDVVADVLTGGKNSRLYKRLVYDLQIAQSVEAAQNSQALSSFFVIEAIPRPGHTVEELMKIIDEEIKALQTSPPTERELERSVNGIEASFYNGMERVGGFGGKADKLNSYYTITGDPDWFNEDLARYRALSTSDVQAAASAFLPQDRRVELTVVPERAQQGDR